QPPLHPAMLQRSRAVFSAETIQRDHPRDREPQASTEPRCVQRGNKTQHTATNETTPSFNGAALCSARKHIGSVMSTKTCTASTEPRCVQRGNGNSFVTARKFLRLLQRSRAVFSA